MLRKIRIFVLCALCLALTGCFGGREVNERAFVQLMGIEKDGGVYTVNLQLYKGGGSGGSPDISQSNSEAVSGSGATVPAALADAGLKAGRSLYLGHIKLMIIGQGITNPAEELSVLAGAGMISPSCPIVYCDDPESVTSLELEDGLYSADRVMRIMQTYVCGGKCLYTSYASLAESSSQECAASPLPVIEAEEESVRFDGTVFASSDGIYNGLSSGKTAGLMLLNGSFPKKGRITVTSGTGEKTVSAAITGAETCRKADISDGRLRVNVTVKLKLDTSSCAGITGKEAADAVCEAVRDLCIDSYSAAVWSGSDVFGLYRLIRRDCPELADRDRDALLRESILNITVKASAG